MENQQISQGDPIDLRERAKGAARWFNAYETWLPLARLLTEIREAKSYRDWGFSSFSSYLEMELDIPKSVGSELVLAYKYLVFRHPECLEEDRSAAEQLPSYANIVILARNRSRLPEDVAQALDQPLFTGSIKRKALKEAIAKALPKRVRLQGKAQEGGVAQNRGRGEAHSHVRTEHQEILGAVETFCGGLDLPALREQLTLVFEGWGEEITADRRQLLARLHGLLDQLEELKRTLEITYPDTPLSIPA